MTSWTKGRNADAIGVELTEWLHEGQMRMAQEKLREEERFLSILGTEREAKPESIGFVLLWFKDGAKFPGSDQKKNGFRYEFYDLLKNADKKIWKNPATLDTDSQNNPLIYLRATKEGFSAGQKNPSKERPKPSWIRFKPCMKKESIQANRWSSETLQGFRCPTAGIRSLRKFGESLC